MSKHPTTLFPRATAKDGKVHALKPAKGGNLWYRETVCGKDFGLVVTAAKAATCEKCLSKMPRTHQVSMGVEEAEGLKAAENKQGGMR
jgi:regulation of enolase protein 1 (concanavalin A-like superfamily)